MRHRTPPRRPPLRRRGLSIVEVMLALVLVSVGLLGIAGSSALALRTAGSAEREHRAVRIAALRLARLAAEGCGTARSDDAADDGTGFTERWAVGPAANGVATVDVRVGWRQSGPPRSLVVRSALLC